SACGQQARRRVVPRERIHELRHQRWILRRSRRKTHQSWAAVTETSKPAICNQQRGTLRSRRIGLRNSGRTVRRRKLPLAHLRGEAVKSLISKRSIVIAGHKTSVSLEDEFWNSLKEIAEEGGMTLAESVAAIDGRRQHSNLSSALRLFGLAFYRDQRRKAAPWAIFSRRPHQLRSPPLSRSQPRNSSTACLASFSRRSASLLGLSESPPIAETWAHLTIL